MLLARLPHAVELCVLSCAIERLVKAMAFGCPHIIDVRFVDIGCVHPDFSFSVGIRTDIDQLQVLLQVA